VDVDVCSFVLQSDHLDEFFALDLSFCDLAPLLTQSRNECSRTSDLCVTARISDPSLYLFVLLYSRSWDGRPLPPLFTPGTCLYYPLFAAQ
jgi:hypothetical protein